MSLRLPAADGTMSAWAPASSPKVVLLVDAGGPGPLAASRAALLRAALPALGLDE